MAKLKNPPLQIYWDTNVFLGFLNEDKSEKNRNSSIKLLIDKAEQKKFTINTSAITVLPGFSLWH